MFSINQIPVPHNYANEWNSFSAIYWAASKYVVTAFKTDMSKLCIEKSLSKLLFDIPEQKRFLCIENYVSLKKNDIKYINYANNKMCGQSSPSAVSCLSRSRCIEAGWDCYETHATMISNAWCSLFVSLSLLCSAWRFTIFCICHARTHHSFIVDHSWTFCTVFSYLPRFVLVLEH